MKKIFCYGTLQEPSVLVRLIGRTVTGPITRIMGYVVLCDYVDPADGVAYPRLVPHKNGCVYGRVLLFKDSELSILNEYETDMYKLEPIDVQGYSNGYVYMPTNVFAN
jgi:gamma-glutamylcyclotransferase (GGCT)/AIG2-like uncharacterized protein YtfP